MECRLERSSSRCLCLMYYSTCTHADGRSSGPARLCLFGNGMIALREELLGGSIPWLFKLHKSASEFAAVHQGKRDASLLTFPPSSSTFLLLVLKFAKSQRCQVWPKEGGVGAITAVCKSSFAMCARQGPQRRERQMQEAQDPTTPHATGSLPAIRLVNN